MQTIKWIIQAGGTLLRGVVDKFKQKNASVFLAISAVLWGAWYGVGEAMDYEGVTGKADEILASVQMLIMALMNAIGAHTPEPGNNSGN